MNRLLLAIMTLTLSGCHSYDKLMGTSNSQPNQVDTNVTINVVACCQDNDGSGNLSWPAFVPQSHRDLCSAVQLATSHGEKYNGQTYIDTHVDCGKFGYKIGDQYYPSTGY